VQALVRDDAAPNTATSRKKDSGSTPTDSIAGRVGSPRAFRQRGPIRVSLADHPLAVFVEPVQAPAARGKFRAF
jgi:hypothetical protein